MHVDQMDNSGLGNVVSWRVHSRGIWFWWGEEVIFCSGEIEELEVSFEGG
jgi:hypothetical protein